MMRSAVFVVIALCVRIAHASPEEASAEAARGKAAYLAEDYAAAADAYHKAYDLDPQSEYMFGWAQALRKAGDCAVALELYTKLLAMPLDETDAAATRQAMARCEVKPPPPPPPQQPEPPLRLHGRVAWYEDWTANLLVAGGLIVIGGGTWMTLQSVSDERVARDATTYGEHERLTDRATILRVAGIGAAALGVIGVSVGAYRYATHGRNRQAISAWVGGQSGGLAIGGVW